jgi:hypothetical protein
MDSLSKALPSHRTIYGTRLSVRFACHAFRLKKSEEHGIVFEFVGKLCGVFENLLCGPEVSRRSATGLVTTACSGSPRVVRSVYWIAVDTPAIHPANELFHAKAKSHHVERTFGGTVAADTVAVGNNQCGAIQVRGGGLIHAAVRDVDCARDVISLVDLRLSGIDDDDVVPAIQRLV